MQFIKKNFYKLFISVIVFASLFQVEANAEVFYLNGGIKFDTVYYTEHNNDVFRMCGYDKQKLINHYLKYGMFEGRMPAQIYECNMDLIRLGKPVPWDFLYKRKEIRSKCDQLEFEYAWNKACEIVNPIMGQDRMSQMKSITASIQATVNDHVPYTFDTYHHNDACGVFGCDIAEHSYGASAEGVTRATGMCLAMCGIQYEHVYMSNLKHQWCRVKYNGQYYICDPYLNYVGLEPAPYQHPYIP